MSEIPWALLPFVAAVIVFGGLAKGTLGFGLIVTTVPFLSLAMPPKDAMAWMAIPILLLNLWAVFLTRREWRELRRIALFLPAGLALVPLGVRLVVWMPPDATRAGMGAFILLVVAMRLAGWEPARHLAGRWLSAAWGAASGLIHGALMMPAPPVVLYLNFTGAPRDAFVLLLNVCASSFLLFQILSFASLGTYAGGGGWMGLAMLVPALAGMHLGNRLRQRLSQRLFERLVLGLLGVVALSLLARYLLRLL